MLTTEAILALSIVVIAIVGGAIGWHYFVLSAKIDDGRTSTSTSHPPDDAHSND